MMNVYCLFYVEVVRVGWVEKTYGSDMSSRYVSFLQRRNLPKLREAFKPLVESRLGVPIRHVVAYEETTVNGGFCETCSFEYVVVKIVFKSSEGKLCVYTIEDTLWDLMRRLTTAPQ